MVGNNDNAAGVTDVRRPRYEMDVTIVWDRQNERRGWL